MACTKKITLAGYDSDGSSFSRVFENTDFRTGGRLYLSHSISNPVIEIRKYHPVGVTGNFVNRLGFTGQNINLIVQYVGNFADQQSGIQGDMEKFLNYSTSVTIDLSIDGTVQQDVYSRCTCNSFSLQEGPKGLVIPGKTGWVRSIYAISLTAEEPRN